jgi:alpha-L-fucosidase
MKQLSRVHPFRTALVVVLAVVIELAGVQRGAAQLILYPGYVPVSSTEPESTVVRKAASVVPTSRQLAWQRQETIGFVHFGLNTFTGQEWGSGNVDPALFNPTDFDARQWVRVLKAAGLKTVIVTAKHHDGFCLWPTKYTEYSVRSAPWRSGKGDVVGDLAAACREQGVGFGVYLSPWDRHESAYGDSPRYNEHFRNQLRELLTNYGPVTEVWFDGANGEGPNGKQQVYDWSSYYALIRKLQPDAVIAISGPDVRWVGTESGYGRDTEWSVVPATLQDQDSVAAASQQAPVDGAFVPGDLTQVDLGSRARLRDAHALIWYPAETDVSIRPGWFYHAAQDGRVKSPEKLVDIYYSSVGKNSVLLLNVPPDQRGRIHDNDAKALEGMRKILDRTFSLNLAAGARITASSEEKGHHADYLVDGSDETSWIPAGNATSGWVECVFPASGTFDRAMLQEDVRFGQHVERFHLEAWQGSGWDTVARGTTIGYKRLLRFGAVTAERVRLVIDQARLSPVIARFGLFKAPPQVTFSPAGGGFVDTITVTMAADVEGMTIRYTVDGSDPTPRSPVYTGPVRLTQPVTIRAYAAPPGAEGVTFQEAQFVKSRQVVAVTLAHPPARKYWSSGPMSLVDGKRGLADLFERDWLGFEGDSMIATLDLGGVASISTVTVGFLQNQGSWIFLPTAVAIAVSEDGMTWTDVGDRTFPLAQNESVSVSDVAIRFTQRPVRYVRVSAANVGICPSWHAGAGTKAWLFADEVTIQ